MADIDPQIPASDGSRGPARSELAVTTGPIRGSRKTQAGL